LGSQVNGSFFSFEQVFYTCCSSFIFRMKANNLAMKTYVPLLTSGHVYRSYQ
jgi:hypothetical protein